MDRNLKVILLIGIPASGKSTWAKNFIAKNKSWVRVSRDDFRFMLKNMPITENKVEELITDLQDNVILKSLAKKLNVVVDATHVKVKYLNHFIELVKYHADVEFMVFDTSLQKCLERDSARERTVGKHIIEKMHKSYKILVGSFNFTYRTKLKKVEKSKILKQAQINLNDLPEAAIFDIDGTLALMGNRSPYDWHKVDNDYINPMVVDHLLMQKEAGARIILLSGRDSAAREKTIEWLDFYEIPYDDLFMRAKDDFRKDSIVKKELFNNNIKDKYFVKLVYDDRDQVVTMWRNELGLTVFQVNEGTF